MNFQDIKIIIGQIKKNVKCPKCKNGFTDCDIEIIGSLSEDQTFFHGTCQKCFAETVINVSLQLDDMDLIVPELTKFANNSDVEKVSVNEVLDIHNFLEKFDGNFKSLFQAKKT